MNPRHLLLGTLAFGLLLQPARAAIIYSGLQNIPIPTDFNGVFINVDTGAYGASAMTGWDINPFFGGAGIANSPSFQPARTSTANDAPIVRLSFSDFVDAGLNYSTGFGGSGDPVSHLGTDPGQFTIGDFGYFAFQLTTDNNDGPYYGWMQAIFTDASTVGSIVDWAYEDTGSPIAVGAAPEPSRSILLMLGFMGLLARRRRQTC